ncbi:MAG: chromate resistance protein ChrB domain-containing protein [Pseudomonadota bacterium]
MKWITRERPKIDRIACPWLVKRFIDPEAEFLFVAADRVKTEAERLGATPFDIPGVELSHDGPRCSFDAFLKRYQLNEPALLALATIVRAADTDRLQDSPQAAGLLAISLGLSANIKDDHQLLAAGFVIYDALYTWCHSGQHERHTWQAGTATGAGALP